MVPFLISMALMVFQQWSGVNTVIFYTVTIFTAARVSINPHVASNMVGVVQFLATAGKLHALIHSKNIVTYFFANL